jgi:hypothetical protein
VALTHLFFMVLEAEKFKIKAQEDSWSGKATSPDS